MNILKSFELFWSFPKKLFEKKFIKVVHVETANADTTADSVQTEFTDDTLQFNVYNNQKVYSLLTSVLYKKKQLNENKIRKIS